MNNQSDANIMEYLENLIDKEGITFVLNTIVEICYEKSEHILTNWDDVYLSDMWDDAGDQIDEVAFRLTQFAIDRLND